MERALNMILRMIMRRLMNRGIGAGMTKAAGDQRAQRRETPAPVSSYRRARHADVSGVIPAL